MRLASLPQRRCFTLGTPERASVPSGAPSSDRGLPPRAVAQGRSPEIDFDNHSRVEDVGMSDDRRYSDDEVARIFELAAKPDVSVRDTSGSEGAEGLTLAELQAIGREVGIAPEHIADAAMTLDAGASETPPDTDFGMEISVGRAVRLARAFTDREWAMLVSELRDTFRARGSEASSGDARQWFNGNLHARVEPTPTGYRFRVATLKGDAPAL